MTEEKIGCYNFQHAAFDCDLHASINKRSIGLRMFMLSNDRFNYIIVVDLQIMR